MHNDGNSIDLAMSSKPEIVSEVLDEGHLGGSDHTMVWRLLRNLLRKFTGKKNLRENQGWKVVTVL